MIRKRYVVDTQNFDGVLRQINTVGLVGLHSLQRWQARPINGGRQLLLRTWQNRLDGLNLEQWMATPQGQLPALRADVARQLSRALVDWHDHGFVHGDLSLRNIMVVPCGGGVNVRAVDWLLDLQKPSGTPRFSAPPFWRGRRSHEGDRYAVSLINRLLLTSRRNDEAQPPAARPAAVIR